MNFTSLFSVTVTSVPSPSSRTNPEPIVFVSAAAIVTVSLAAVVVMVTLVPAANVSVSASASATTLSWPDTEIVLKADSLTSAPSATLIIVLRLAGVISSMDPAPDESRPRILSVAETFWISA